MVVEVVVLASVAVPLWPFPLTLPFMLAPTTTSETRGSLPEGVPRTVWPTASPSQSPERDTAKCDRFENGNKCTGQC